MNNWFKTGIYSKQLTAIGVLLLILCIGQLSSCVDKAFAAQTVIKSKSVLIEDRDSSGSYATVEDRQRQAYVDNHPRLKAMDYQIRLDDNVIQIWDGNRLVGTLTYRTSLGRMVLRDNE